MTAATKDPAKDTSEDRASARQKKVTIREGVGHAGQDLDCHGVL